MAWHVITFNRVKYLSGQPRLLIASTFHSNYYVIVIDDLILGSSRKYADVHKMNKVIFYGSRALHFFPVLEDRWCKGAALCLLTRWTGLHRISLSHVFLVLSLLCVHIFVLNYVPCGGSEDKS